MFVLGNVLVGLGSALNWLFQFYIFVLIGRAIVSWVDASPYNPIVRFLVMATEPPRRLIWRLLPRSLREFPIDMAFLVLFAVVVFLQVALVQTLADFGAQLRLPRAY